MTLEEENARQAELLTELCRFITVFYGLPVPCPQCGAPAMAACISESGKTTIHQRRVTQAAVEIPAAGLLASDLLKGNQRK